MINAIDMHTRKVLWQNPLGTARANGPFGLPTGLPVRFGVPSNGGPITTVGGLVFIAAATDNLRPTSSGQTTTSAYNSPPST